MTNPLPNNKIYVPTNWYLHYGKDDFLGGIATISDVKTEGGKTYVSIKERPGWEYNWEFLAKNQAAWKDRFGNRMAKPDPDLTPESNTGFVPEINKRGNKIERFFYDDRTPGYYRESLSDEWREFAARSRYSGAWHNHGNKHIILFDNFEEQNIYCHNDEAFSNELIAITSVYGVFNELE